MKLTLRGLQQAQAANNRSIAALKPNNALGRGIVYATTALHRYTVAITHVWRYKGGGLRAGHRMQIDQQATSIHGMIYIDPQAVNPRGQKPSIYGPFEHARGGDHAFYARAVDEAGERVAKQAVRIIYGSLA
jgi:hypothetical protein